MNPRRVRQERWRTAKEIGKRTPWWLASIGIGLALLAGGIALCLFTLCIGNVASAAAFFGLIIGWFALMVGGMAFTGLPFTVAFIWRHSNGFLGRTFLLPKKKDDPDHIEEIDEFVLSTELRRMRDAKATFVQARDKWVDDERKRFVSAATEGCAPHAFVGADRSEWLQAFL